MAEVATKKSINVLDNITASNKQLISLCESNDDEDDLILTNNTRNELDADDKSLQELIESELALRICSNAGQQQQQQEEEEEEDGTGIEMEDGEGGKEGKEAEAVIVLDRQQEHLDVNAEFIAAETEHSAGLLVGKAIYGYQNGHVSPDTGVVDTRCYEGSVEPGPIAAGFPGEGEGKEEQVLEERAEVGSGIAIEETTTREIEDGAREQAADDGGCPRNEEDNEDPCPDYPALRPAEAADRPPDVHAMSEQPFESSYEAEEERGTVKPAAYVDKYREEIEVQSVILDAAAGPDAEQSDGGGATMEEDDEIGLDAWTERGNCGEDDDRQMIGQFSDNFDQEGSCQGGVDEFLCPAEQLGKGMRDDESKRTPIDPFDDVAISESAAFESKASANDKSSGSLEEKILDGDLVEEGSVPEVDVEEGEEEEEARGAAMTLCKSLDDERDRFDAASTEEFLDTERRVLNEENRDERYPQQQRETSRSGEKGEEDRRRNWSEEEEGEEEESRGKEEEGEEESNDNMDEQNAITKSSSELSVSEPTFIEKTEVVISESSVKIVSETQCLEIEAEEREEEVDEGVDQRAENRGELVSPARAPLATPDDETSDVSNAGDSESREETLTTSATTVTSQSAKGGTKTKKKKIEGVAGNDASPNLTPRTKKTKKSKKNELEKENISVKSSFNKFDALSKKTVLHVRSIDAGKVQQQLNAVGQNGDTNPNCRSCGKVVFQMEQTKAEGLVWHKNCFRCVQCSKQLNVDNYESHESTLYCKPHFKELFQPKPVEESDQPASDKPDLGLEELSSLNVKSRFQVFEKAGAETNEIERSPSQIAVKRSPSILSKLAKFQAKGMDIGVADESLNGIPYEESSESEEEEEAEEAEEVDSEIVKAKRATRERPISFTKMDDIKNRWETTSQQGRREVQREARKEEIAGIRSRLFMGKQGKMKEMYQQAVAGSERVTKINAAEEIQHSTHARSIKERFERGEPIAASDDETDSKPKPEKADEEVIAAGISRKSRSLFLELDATAAKTGRPVTPVNPKTPAEQSRRARDMDSPEREIYRDPDVVRADDRVNEVVHTDTARKMLSIFRQMEENACKKELPNGPKPLKRFTPPPEDKYAKATASDSEEDEDEDGEESEGEDSGEERDPNYVRASDKVEDEFLKQAQNAARAKTLCAKFEHWEETDGKTTTSNQHIAEMEIAQNSSGEQLSIESASSLRARFESLGSQTNESPRTPKVKVNRFVEIQASCADVCESCEKKVYPLEKVETNNKIFHKQCFRCLQCNCVLRMDTFTLNNGKLYCIPHFKQLFITRGNYDEGFGVDPHKNKWTTSSSNPTSPSPIAVSNGDL
ncbi:uncharacterized protein LOC107996281 isoform X30 [Apis cerana]|uniref:uncharacterized protein LOC107996281 isoform X30 n=1 Tax=Apis cerana TaxID=7461 RepID=UPI002B22B25B|nr:uncharacterized protein LOC107996281 isoform X30 [Apis cerana]